MRINVTYAYLPANLYHIYSLVSTTFDLIYPQQHEKEVSGQNPGQESSYTLFEIVGNFIKEVKNRENSTILCPVLF